MPISRKLFVSLLTSALTFAAGLALTKLGLNINPSTASYISGGVALAAAALTGWLVKEVPGLVK